MLTFDGLVEAVGGREAAQVPPGFGLRAVEAKLSDVVPATTFAELDAALDGCPGSFSTDADVRLNVRVGPGTSFNKVGTIAPEDIANLIGIDPSGKWYRIPFRDGYGWVLAEAMRVTIEDSCVALAPYPATHSEDIARYSLVGELEVNAFVRVETANVRSGPGLTFDRIAQLEQGTELIITGRNSNSSWFRVRTLDGVSGWMANFLVQVETEIEQIGVVPAEEVPAAPELIPVPTQTPTPTPEAGLDDGAGA